MKKEEFKRRYGEDAYDYKLMQGRNYCCAMHECESKRYQDRDRGKTSPGYAKRLTYASNLYGRGGIMHEHKLAYMRA